MKPFYYVLAVLALVGLVPALYIGAMWVAHFNVPFIAFTVPVWLDLALACWAMHKLELEQ